MECLGNPLFKDRLNPHKFRHREGCNGEAKWKITFPDYSDIQSRVSEACLDWCDQYDLGLKVEKLTEFNSVVV